jgi:hypothetical protein
VISELAVAKELSQHRKRVQRQRLIDERLLTVQCLDCRATRERIFSVSGIRNFRIQLAHCAQAVCLTAIPPIQRLAENILSAGSIVADIKPLSKRFSVYV